MGTCQPLRNLWKGVCIIALSLLASVLSLNDACAAAKDSLRRSAIVVAVEKGVLLW